MSSDQQRYVVIDFEGSVELMAEEVWSDSPPADWDIDDAVEAIEATGNVISLLRDWDLTDVLEVTVTDDEGYTAHPWRLP
jgi:hypothetical protein